MKNSVSPVALVSVFDKSGVVFFSRSLVDSIGARLISSSGTAAVLSQNLIEVETVESWTGFSEVLGGRVKTLHPKIHAAILAESDNENHLQDLLDHDVSRIDLVVVNLYPFQKVLSEFPLDHEKIIENIDIGGAALLRSAAKNYKDVLVVVDPSDYERVLQQLSKSDGVDSSFRVEMAMKAFKVIADYDLAISAYFSSYYRRNFLVHKNDCQFSFESHLLFSFRKLQDLRYGENSHQKAALYLDNFCEKTGLTHSILLQGKALSYNNLVDADTAWSCVSAFSESACVIVKHATPSGLAIADNALEAYRKALMCDPISAFGGIVAFNCAVDDVVAKDVLGVFVEVVIAPGFSDAAVKMFSGKPNIRILLAHGTSGGSCEFRCIDGGGVLLQERNDRKVNFAECRVVSNKHPNKLQWRDLLFSWGAVKYVKSNAIIFCLDGMSLGIGAGQTSRIDAVDVAVSKATSRNLDLRGSVVASDAFFPFSDSIERIAETDAAAIIHPGGSVRDQEIIDKANQCDLIMIFTGVRCFRH